MDAYPPNQSPRTQPLKQMIRGFFIALLIFIGGVMASGQAMAAADVPGLTITPSIYQLDLSNSTTRPYYDIVVRNVSDQPVELQTSSLDITGQARDGSTVFAAPGADTDHDIGSSLRYEPARFQLAAGASQTVRVTINQPESLEPGGHYGAAVFTVVNGPANGESVGLQQAVSSLLFVTTSSGGIRRVGQPAFTIPRFNWQLPKTVDVIIPNDGNTQFAPLGSVQLIRHGSVVADGNVNPEGNLVLSGQNRLFKVPLRLFEGRQLAGRYEVVLRVRATQDSPETVRTMTIVYVNPWFVVAVVIAVTVCLWLGYRIRRYRLHKRLRN